MTVQYAEVADFTKFGLPEKAIANVSLADLAAALQAASEEAEGYIGNANPLPLTAWGNDLRMHVCGLAAWLLLKVKGFNPDGRDEIIRTGRTDAIDWLTKVAKGIVKPVGFVPADNLGVKTSSGNPDAPDNFKPEMSNNWGDFG